VDIMPYYEYLCDKGHEVEVQQKITDEPIKTCHKQVGATDAGIQRCNAPCKRQLCKSSFALKGGGWSGDGYAKKGN
jgi:predicted nucleic acid-binding Zn ribbon protein